MRRAHLVRPAPASVAAFAALLLTACGGGGEVVVDAPADAPSPGDASGPPTSSPQSGPPQPGSLSEPPKSPDDVTSTVPDPWSG